MPEISRTWPAISELVATEAPPWGFVRVLMQISQARTLPMDCVAVPITSVPLEFSRKRPRDYVHGPDMFNAVQSIARSGSNTEKGVLELDLHAWARRQCTAHVDSENPGKVPPEACAVFRFDGGTRRLFGWISEDGRPLASETDYEESALRPDMTQRSDAEIVYAGNSPYSVAEVAVATTKELHQRLFPVPGRWIVTKFVARAAWPVTPGERTIHCRLKANLHNRITSTEITLNGRPSGLLYFSAVEST